MYLDTRVLIYGDSVRECVYTYTHICTHIIYNISMYVPIIAFKFAPFLNMRIQDAVLIIPR